MSPSAVLFDFNGVLVDDEHLHRESFNAVLAPLGVHMTEMAYTERFLGLDDRGAFTAVLGEHGRATDAAQIEVLIAAKAEVYLRRAATELRIFPGASDLLRTVAARVPVGIVSGALRPEIDAALRVMGLASVVRFIVAAEDVTACKPDPEGYAKGLAQLGLAGAVVVAIEDSVAGIESARAAGLGVLAVEHSYPREALVRAGAREIVTRVGDVTWGHLVRASSRDDSSR